MDGNEMVVVIAAVSGMLVAVISAIFSGIVALKQLPEAKRDRKQTLADVATIKEDTAETRRQSDGTATRLQNLNDSLTQKLDNATADALAASRAREMPMPDAEHPMPVTVSDTPVEVRLVTED